MPTCVTRAPIARAKKWAWYGEGRKMERKREREKEREKGEEKRNKKKEIERGMK